MRERKLLKFPSDWQTGLVAALFGVLLSGCQSTRTTLVPASQAQQVPNVAQAASETMQGVSILVESGDWPGDPQIENQVTPLRVEVENRSDQPLRLRYNDFSIVSATDGDRFAALPPYRIEGSVSEKVVATYDRPISRVGFRHRGFYVSPYYHGLYPNIDYWAHPFHYDPFYYDHYAEYWRESPLPTDEMLRRVIPEGVVEPGGIVAGYVYFEKVDADLSEVEFRYELTNADNGERFGMLTIPFLVSSE